MKAAETHEEENIDVMEMSYEAYAMIGWRN
jgi:hypothetical protein